MTQLNIKHLKKAFGDNEVLKDISFDISYGERIGIVGVNGCGKSTLLNIISGLEPEDEGEIYISKQLSIKLLEQNSFCDTKSDEINYTEKRCLNILNIGSNRFNDLSTLSGGEKTRLALYKIISLNPDLLLLDEPTNNLDIDGIKILIDLLNFYKGTILVVSHDRYFLDNIVSRIIEIEYGNNIEYLGNYTYYRQAKEKLFKEKMHRYENDKKQQKNIKESITQVKQWSTKAHQNSTKADSSGVTMGAKEKKRAKAKKMDKKVKNDVKRLEKLIVTGEKKPIAEKKVYFEIKSNNIHGKLILQATDIRKSFNNKKLFDKSNFYINRGEKVALYGLNGCGKSTLINIIQKTENIDNGEVWVSPSSEPYVVSQYFLEFPKNTTTLKYLIDIIGNITGEDRTLLNNMGLTAKHLSQKIETLSYGEQMKLKLVESILKHKDFIILDEPTNHLDLHAREMLEETLSQYQGTLLIVSHDIYFLKKICDKVLIFDREQIIRLEDSFEEYLNK